MTRAKFRCTSKIPNKTNPEYGNVSLLVVHNGSQENKEFFNMTPCGSIELGLLNPKAFEQFEPGKEYYVDFTPA